MWAMFSQFPVSWLRPGRPWAGRLLALLAGVGILLNISMHSTHEAAVARRSHSKLKFPFFGARPSQM